MRCAGVFQVVLVWGVVACGAPAYAGWPFGPDKKEEAPAAQAPQEPAPDPEELERRRIASEGRAQLEGTTWTLDVKPYRSADTSAKPFTDELTFKDGTVSSARFGKAGYSASQYSVNVQGTTPLWETMQRKEGEGTLTWSGELYGQAMGGIVTRRPSDPEKPAEHFQFTGTLVPKTPPAPEPVAEPQELAAPSPQAEAPPSAEPPKKRGWFW